MVTHEEINDKSVEGVRHRDFPAFSVQFHPDAAPGPHDASYLFDEFLELIDAFQAEKHVVNCNCLVTIVGCDSCWPQSTTLFNDNQRVVK